MLYLHNLRIGFATNSSSSHSIVIIPEGVSVSSIEAHYDNSYNWEHFRLTTTEEKMRYAAAQLLNNLNDQTLWDSIITRFQDEIPDYGKGFVMGSWDDAPSVDHESVNPQVFNETMINLLRNDRIVILGGNDNTQDHPNEVPGMIEVVDLARGSGRMRVRQDGENFILFNRKDGTKARVSLNNSVSPYEKSNAPELVDVKITDWCDVGCKFCYQSSTTAGKHAPLERIKAIIDMLAEMGVFEIAIGGGEPTSHPDFAEILRYADSKDIVPNFTTLSRRWLENPEIIQACRSVGGIGVSVSNAKALDLVHDIKEKMLDAGNYDVQVMAQHVVGAAPLRVTADFLNSAIEKEIPVLLLGYKTVGFGADYVRHDNNDADVFLKLALKDYSNAATRTLSVDTALLDQYPGILEAIGAPKALASSPEGKFSCYIDAVADTVGASSYVEPSEMQPMPTDIDAFKALYAEF